MNIYKTPPVHIIYYVFVGHLQNWIGSVKGQIEDLCASNLLKNNYLHVCLSGTSEIMSQAKTLIDQLIASESPQVDYTYTEQNLYEYPGFTRMYNLAKEHSDHLYLYLHSKGVSRTKAPMDRSIDNIYLTRLTVWNNTKVFNVFTDCPNINKIGYFPSSGGWMWFNFFWVRGSYLAKCREPIMTPRRHYYEDWLGTSNKTGISDCYCLYNDKIGHYFTPHEACQTIAHLYNKVNFVCVNQPFTKVTYGVNGNQIDITEQFSDLLTQKQYIRVGNSLVSEDPCYGTVKQLSITLQNGLVFKFREGDYILLCIKQHDNHSCQIDWLL